MPDVAWVGGRAAWPLTPAPTVIGAIDVRTTSTTGPAGRTVRREEPAPPRDPGASVRVRRTTDPAPTVADEPLEDHTRRISTGPVVAYVDGGGPPSWRVPDALALRPSASSGEVAVEAKARGPGPKVGAYLRAANTLRAAVPVAIKAMGGPTGRDEVLAATVVPPRPGHARPVPAVLAGEPTGGPLALHARRIGPSAAWPRAIAGPHFDGPGAAARAVVALRAVRVRCREPTTWPSPRPGRSSID